MAVRDIAVADGAIRIEVAGAGTPLMLLHGWALDRSVWAPQIAALSRHFRVVAIDRRGFGGSTAPPGLAREPDDIAAVQQALGLGPMVLAGMSQGGRIALRFALAYPDRLLGLVLQGAPLDGFQPDARGHDVIPLSSYAGLVREGRIERMRALWRDHPLMHAGTRDAEARLDALVARYDGRDLLVPPDPAFGSVAADLDAIFAPALVITGDADTPWRRLVGDALAYGLPNGQRAGIPGAGHLCNLTHPGSYNDLVTAFVRRLEGVPAAAAVGGG